MHKKHFSIWICLALTALLNHPRLQASVLPLPTDSENSKTETCHALHIDSPGLHPIPNRITDTAIDAISRKPIPGNTIDSIARSVNLNEVVVTGTRNATDIRHLPMTVSVITHRQIEESHEVSLLPLLSQQVRLRLRGFRRGGRRHQPARHRGRIGLSDAGAD